MLTVWIIIAAAFAAAGLTYTGLSHGRSRLLPDEDPRDSTVYADAGRHRQPPPHRDPR